MGLETIGTATLLDGGFLVTNLHVANKIVMLENKLVPGRPVKRTPGRFENGHGWITLGCRDLKNFDGV